MRGIKPKSWRETVRKGRDGTQVRLGGSTDAAGEVSTGRLEMPTATRSFLLILVQVL
jgi:hypothetical protein